MSATKYDCDHEFVKKVQDFHQKNNVPYELVGDEVDLARVFVNRGFIYYARDEKHVAPIMAYVSYKT